MNLLIPLSLWESFYGMLSAMMQPLYWAVSGLVVLFFRLFSPILGHDGFAWALAIICLTVSVRTLLIPLFVRQINTSRSMQLIQPKVAELQKRYGSDRERLGQETMKLYKEEGVNPTASCLPLLLQMPIFLSLFRVLEGVASGHVRGHFFKVNPDLVSSLQNASIFGAGLAKRVFPITPFGATQVVGIVLVISMVGVLFVTQLQLLRKNMPPEALVGPMAQQQKMMLYLFPAIYLFSATVIPIGVLIYWLASNLWTLGQQYLLIRNNPAPNTPAYLEWEERMRAHGKDPEAVMAARLAKRRKTVKAPRQPAEGSESKGDRVRIERQAVTRQTVVRPDQTERADGGGRAQPVRKSRAARKKR